MPLELRPVIKIQRQAVGSLDGLEMSERLLKLQAQDVRDELAASTLLCEGTIVWSSAAGIVTRSSSSLCLA